jgi:phage baseplate assembly protein W
MTLDYPLRIDGRGRTAATTSGDHIRDLIEQVLFTAPGERVMRPNFGCGLLGLTFAPASSELAASVQFLVQGALNQELGTVIVVDDVSVSADDPSGPGGGASVSVSVAWTVRSTGVSGSASYPVATAGATL